MSAPQGFRTVTADLIPRTDVAPVAEVDAVLGRLIEQAETDIRITGARMDSLQRTLAKLRTARAGLGILEGE